MPYSDPPGWLFPHLPRCSLFPSCTAFLSRGRLPSPLAQDKFALFVQATVVASLVWSLLIFSGGLLVLVPEEGGRWWAGDLRDVATWWRRCWAPAKGAAAGGGGDPEDDEEAAADAGADAKRDAAPGGDGRGGDGGGGGSGDGGSGSGSGSGGGHGGAEADWAATPAHGGSKRRPPSVADYTVPVEQ